MDSSHENCFSISAAVLLPVVAILRKVIINKPVIPAFENLRFDVHDGWLKMTAADGETTVSLRRELIASTLDASFLVPPTFVGDTLKGLSSHRLDFVVADGRMEVSWCDGRISVPTFDIQDWPEDESVKGMVETAQLSCDDLSKGIELTEYACAKDDLRPQLCGVQLSFLGAGKGLVMVGTNAHVLAVASVPAASSPRAFSFLLPKRTAAHLKAVLPGMADVMIQRDDRQVVFRVEDTGLEVRGRLMEGKFPNWRSVIPKQFSAEADLARVSVQEAILRQGACSGPGKALTMDFEEAGLTVSSRDLGMGVEGEETVAATFEGPAPVSVCFRLDYIKAVVDNMPAARLRFCMNGSHTAVVIRDADKEERKAARDTKKKKEAAQGVSVFTLIMPIMDVSKE